MMILWPDARSESPMTSLNTSCIEAADSSRISAARSGAPIPEIESIAAAATNGVASVWMVRRTEDREETQGSTDMGLLQAVARSGLWASVFRQGLNPANGPQRSAWANALETSGDCDQARRRCSKTGKALSAKHQFSALPQNFS